MASSLSSTSEKRKTPSSDNVNGNQPKKNHWSAALSAAIDDESVQVYKDDLCTVINDKFPKACIHLLVMPNENIANLKSVNNTHVSLLKHMLKVGKETAEKVAAKANARGSFAHFRYGYHAIPSMALLHMHVISQDFISDSLKTKKHWNSFTSDYFLDASQVIDDLQANGFIRVDTVRMRKLLDNELTCHRCSNNFTTMPKLKQHLLMHIS
ncbi:unnamed protein product [Rotaria magnacalcarata]|uniref:Aprataxin n=2 Tax=Rotaria magnacalcarata TaxID=392030 RepID=A0A816ZI08_9BILA|nr:unnamed protein product [Rotaria magnacalcarata]CAF1437654.1 unnamed protein product [Rotaria magnacalcarata]CAF2031237.1 unnamed protein product [Rotaria magnacalcarata]CAF2111961.1 unnamed protein product [Rotaria magnacalcarata]CAF2207364.1 unnamed protein product [Rotaria magnacalcarata]